MQLPEDPHRLTRRMVLGGIAAPALVGCGPTRVQAPTAEEPLVARVVLGGAFDAVFPGTAPEDVMIFGSLTESFALARLSRPIDLTLVAGNGELAIGEVGRIGTSLFDFEDGLLQQVTCWFAPADGWKLSEAAIQIDEWIKGSASLGFADITEYSTSDARGPMGHEIMQCLPVDTRSEALAHLRRRRPRRVWMSVYTGRLKNTAFGIDLDNDARRIELLGTLDPRDIARWFQQDRMWRAQLTFSAAPNPSEFNEIEL